MKNVIYLLKGDFMCISSLTFQTETPNWRLEKRGDTGYSTNGLSSLNQGWSYVEK